MNKIVIIVIIIVVVVFGINQLKPKELQGDAVKIVALFPLTGGLSIYGETAQKISQIAVEQINKEGGINGSPLEIIYQDHKCDSKTALSIFEQYVSNVKIFTSAACSGTVLSIAPNLENRQALLLGTLVTTPKISGISPNVFRNWASDAKEAQLFAQEILDREYKKLAIIYEETDYAKGLKISLENYLKDSNVQIMSESFSSGSTDVRTQLVKLKAFNPDIMFISPQTVTSGEVILSQLEQIDLKVNILLNDNIIKMGELLKKHPSLLEGALGGDYVIKEDNNLKKVLNLYKEKYNEECPHTNVCAGVYDSINMLAEAIKKKGYSSDGVREYLESINYKGISGQIRFDSNNDRDNTEYSLFIVKEGEAVLRQ